MTEPKSALEDLNVKRSALSVARSPASPWLGLASFTEETRALFHGRDDEIADLARCVRRKQLTVLFGQSGLGKTSLICAGVVPALRPEGFCPIYVRLHYEPDAPSPAEQIKQAVIRATDGAGTWTRPGVAQPGETLWEFFHHRDDVLHDVDGRTLTPLLIFDQFEEIFTLAQSDDAGRARAKGFLVELADLVENRAPSALEQDETATERFDFGRADYRVLIALREDYLASLEGLRNLMPAITQNRTRLTRMSGAQALDVVLRPGAGLVSDDVARAIVRFVAGGTEIERAEVEPSLLSLVCRELNEARLKRGAPEISADLLAGSRDTILAEFYERGVADQPAGVRQFIEDHLLTDSGFRESVAEERVRRAFTDAGAPGALVALVDRRLLRIEERLDVRRVELTHDVLCKVVAANRDTRHAREAQAEAARRLAESHAREQVTRRALWRARMIAAGASVLAFVAIASAIFGYVNQRRAHHANERAQLARGQAEGLVSFMMEDMRVGLEERGTLKLLKDSAEAAIRYYEALPEGARDAKTEQAYAAALEGVTWVRFDSGDRAGAEDALVRALELRRAGAAKVPGDAECAWKLLKDEYWLVNVRNDEATLKSELFNRELVLRARELCTRFPGRYSARKWLAETLRDFTWRAGGPWVGFNQPKEAYAAAEEALALIEELVAQNPRDRGLPNLKRQILGNLAVTHAWQGRADEAVRISSQSLALAEEALAADPGNLELRRRVAYGAFELRGPLDAISPEGGMEVERSAREHFRTLMEIDPTNRWWKLMFAWSHMIECHHLGFRDKSIEPAREAWRKWDALFDGLEEYQNVSGQRAFIAYWRAHLAANVGDEAEARALLDQAEARYSAYCATLPEGSQLRRRTWITFLVVRAIDPVRALHDWPWLERLSKEALGEIDTALAEQQDGELLFRRPFVRYGLGLAMLRQGRVEESIPVFRQALDDFGGPSEAPPGQSKDGWTAWVQEHLAEALLRTGDTEEGRGLLEAALSEREALAAKPDATWQTREWLAETRLRVAEALDPANLSEAERRRQLLDDAWATLTGPEAEGRITVDGKETKAKVAALRAAAMR